MAPLNTWATASYAALMFGSVITWAATRTKVARSLAASCFHLTSH
jgi:hypothetical protein